MGKDTLNLSQAGLQSKAAVSQGDSADGFNNENNALGRKLETMDREFRGRAGSTFAHGAVNNLEGGAELGKRLAELALGAVLGEKAALEADDNAGQEQQTAVSTSSETRSVVSKTITA